jgi:hypothetical protein
MQLAVLIGPVELLEEVQKLGIRMALGHHAMHRALMDLPRGKQAHDAIAFVLDGEPFHVVRTDFR